MFCRTADQTSTQFLAVVKARTVPGCHQNQLLKIKVSDFATVGFWDYVQIETVLVSGGSVIICVQFKAKQPAEILIKLQKLSYKAVRQIFHFGKQVLLLMSDPHF